MRGLFDHQRDHHDLSPRKNGNRIAPFGEEGWFHPAARMNSIPPALSAWLTKFVQSPPSSTWFDWIPDETRARLPSGH